MEQTLNKFNEKKKMLGSITYILYFFKSLIISNNFFCIFNQRSNDLFYHVACQIWQIMNSNMWYTLDFSVFNEQTSWFWSFMVVFSIFMDLRVFTRKLD